MLLCVIICYYLLLYVIICYYMLLYVPIYIHFYGIFQPRLMTGGYIHTN